MKLSSHLLSIAVGAYFLVGETSAFAPSANAFTTKSSSSTTSSSLASYAEGAGGEITPFYAQAPGSDAEASDDGFFEIFPTYDSFEKIEGQGTVRTYAIPEWATRVQMKLKTNGRPMKGEVNLWLGPLRKTHTLKINNESGAEFPVEALLKFKQGPPILKISTTGDANLPMMVGVHVPSPERAAELEANTEKVFDEAVLGDDKQRIQGGSTNGKHGAWVYYNVPADVDSVQLLGWSRDSGKKSFKANIELLQGPNNLKQSYFLQCGGGSQPYHAVYQTPGPGWVVRIQNKKFMEDGLVDIAVVPYKKGTLTTGMDWGGGLTQSSGMTWN